MSIAAYLINKNKTPIISLVSPYEIERRVQEQIRGLRSVLIYNRNKGKRNFFVKDYEKPLKNFIEIDTNIKQNRKV